MAKATLMVHKQVLETFSRLPKEVCKRVSRFIEEFQENPEDPRLDVHKLEATMTDSKVRGAKLPCGYRAILIRPEKGNVWLLVYIDAHDRAYAWAEKKRFQVHEKTGVFQIFDAEQFREAAVEETSRVQQKNDYPLNALSDDELFQAGVPKLLIPSVRSIRSDEAFEALAEYLPQDSREVLTGIAAGMSLDEALLSVLGPRVDTSQTPVNEGDFSKLDKAPNFDLVLIESDEILREALERPIEAWRIFLHPAQRQLVTWKTKGPVKITGSAGTGKTVALMHRAVHLARRHLEDGERTLFLTFTINLAANIEKQLRDLDPEAAKHIEVTYLASLARTVCRENGWEGVIKLPGEIDDVWSDIFGRFESSTNPLGSNEAIKREFELVIDPAGIEDEDTYLTTARVGQERLGRAQRREVWKYIQELRKELKRRDILTPNAAIKQARLAVEQRPQRRYAHVLADEAQDLGLEALRLVWALSRQEEEAEDPLTLAGDGHQRVYGVRVPLSKAGIQVRGRSRRLRINYRTSQEIRLWAQGILEGQEIDDLDGQKADIRGDRSVFRGPRPEIIEVKSPRDEAEAVAKWIKALLARGIPSHEVCVTPYSSIITQALETQGIQTRELLARQPDLGAEDPGVRIGSMERIKGLEFRAVVLACGDKTDPLNDLSSAEFRDRCSRYVAATRAREALLVTLCRREQC